MDNAIICHKINKYNGLSGFSAMSLIVRKKKPTNPFVYAIHGDSYCVGVLGLSVSGQTIPGNVCAHCV